MATDTDIHRNISCNSWSSPSENHNPQPQAVSEIQDHGSISFGRFAADSLEWEKWSVFSHNRCQEELEKFKAPGLVAQKKAYFEEYYKRIREMKASQAEQQETTGADLNQDVDSHVIQVESGTDAALSKGEKKSSFVRQIQILDDDSSTNSDSSLESIVQKQEVTKELLSNNNEGASITYTTSETSCAFEPDRSMKGTCSFHTPVTRNSEIDQHESRFSNSVKLIANKPKTQGNVASARNRTKSGSRSEKEGIKYSGKKKPSPHDKIIAKEENRIVIGKSSTSKSAIGNSSIHVSSHKKLTEACSSSTVLRASLARNRLGMSSSPTNKTFHTKANLNRRDLANKLPRNLPGYRQSAQCSPKEVVSGGLEQKGTDNRLGNLRIRNKLKQNSSVDFSQCYDRERRQKEGVDQSKSTIGRVSKSANTASSSGQNNFKQVQKNTISQPTNLTHARKEQRFKMPSWR